MSRPPFKLRAHEALFILKTNQPTFSKLEAVEMVKGGIGWFM